MKRGTVVQLRPAPPRPRVPPEQLEAFASAMLDLVLADLGVDLPRVEPGSDEPHCGGDDDLPGTPS